MRGGWRGYKSNFRFTGVGYLRNRTLGKRLNGIWQGAFLKWTFFSLFSPKLLLSSFFLLHLSSSVSCPRQKRKVERWSQQNVDDEMRKRTNRCFGAADCLTEHNSICIYVLNVITCVYVRYYTYAYWILYCRCPQYIVIRALVSFRLYSRRICRECEGGGGRSWKSRKEMLNVM